MLRWVLLLVCSFSICAGRAAVAGSRGPVSVDRALYRSLPREQLSAVSVRIRQRGVERVVRLQPLSTGKFFRTWFAQVAEERQVLVYRAARLLVSDAYPVKDGARIQFLERMERFSEVVSALKYQLPVERVQLVTDDGEMDLLVQPWATGDAESELLRRHPGDRVVETVEAAKNHFFGRLRSVFSVAENALSPDAGESLIGNVAMDPDARLRYRVEDGRLRVYSYRTFAPISDEQLKALRIVDAGRVGSASPDWSFIGNVLEPQFRDIIDWPAYEERYNVKVTRQYGVRVARPGAP
jgi:hypothetical protein